MIKEFDNFGQNHGVTRFEKYQFFDYFKWMVLESRNSSFLFGKLPNTLSYIKKAINKFLKFWTKPWTNPFGKMPMLGRFLIDVLKV